MAGSTSALHKAEQLGLWSQDPLERIRVAKEMPSQLKASLQKEIAATCPVTPWPYGMPTAINPSVVVLGMSPGGLPSDGSQGKPFALPTIGTPHAGIFAEGNKKFFEKVRKVCMIILEKEYGIQNEHALTISGIMNFDNVNYVDARNVIIKTELATWVWNVILKVLRPQFIVGIGLKGQVKRLKPFVSELSLMPDRVITSSIISPGSFDERIIPRPDGGHTRFVLWPQHPSHVYNLSQWEASVREYTSQINAK